MTTSRFDQIAAEAAEILRSSHLSSEDQTAVIQSAIEKATTDILIRHGKKDAEVLKLIEQHERECRDAQPKPSEMLADASWYSDAGEQPPATDAKPREHQHKFPSDGGACEVCGYTARELLSVPQTAPRGEQEWTPEYVTDIVFPHPPSTKTPSAWQRIADAHNAALAAEREKNANTH